MGRKNPSGRYAPSASSSPTSKFGSPKPLRAGPAQVVPMSAVEGKHEQDQSNGLVLGPSSRLALPFGDDGEQKAPAGHAALQRSASDADKLNAVDNHTKTEAMLMDVNHDGNLSQDEWRAKYGNLDGFHKHDTDGDGVISREEAAKAGSELLHQPPCTLNPASQAMQRWDSFVIVLLIYTALVTPFEVGFMGEPELGPLWVINRCVDLGFIIDMIFQFFLGFFDPFRAIVVYNKRMIAWHYLTGWFPLDFISCLPFDALGFAIKASGGSAGAAQQFEQLKILRIVRLFRLIKLLRLLRSARILNRIKTKLGWTYLTFSMLQFACILIFLTHLMACLWGAGADILQAQDDEAMGNTWIHDLGLTEAPNWEKYVGAVGFALAAMLMGYGEITPSNSGQRVLALSCMLIGGAVYVYLIGAICEAVASIDPASSEFKRTVDMLNLYLVELRVDLDLRRTCREYFYRSKEMLRHSYYQEVLAKLSPKLRATLALHRHQGWLSQVKFFNCSDTVETERFYEKVAMRMNRAAFDAQEVICRAGDPASAMYIIQFGMVGYSGGILQKDDYFGIDMIQSSGICSETASTITYCDTMFLARDDLLELLQGNFPRIRKLVRKAAFKMVLHTFVKQVGHAHRLMNDSKRLSRKQIEEWKQRHFKSREERAQLKAKLKQERDIDYSDPASVDVHALEESLPEGVQFATEQKSVLEAIDSASISELMKKQFVELQQHVNGRMDKVQEQIDKSNMDSTALAAQVAAANAKLEILLGRIDELSSR